MKAIFSSITPLIPTGASLTEALGFFTEHLGFSIVWQDEGMAGLERDSVRFNLVKNENKAWAENSSFSIGISDLEALYLEYRGIPAKVGPLETKPWGRREFHLIASAGHLLSILSK